MNPPRVYEVTIPRSHRTTKIVKIVQSMSTPNSFSFEQNRSRSTQGREGRLTRESALRSSLQQHPKMDPPRLAVHLRTHPELSSRVTLPGLPRQLQPEWPASVDRAKPAPLASAPCPFSSRSGQRGRSRIAAHSHGDPLSSDRTSSETAGPATVHRSRQ